MILNDAAMALGVAVTSAPVSTLNVILQTLYSSTVNREIFNGNKFSRLAESMKEKLTHENK